MSSRHPEWYFDYFNEVFGSSRDYSNDVSVLGTEVQLCDKTIREIGAGTGEHAHVLLGRRPQQLDLVDSDPRAVDVLRSRFGSEPSVSVSLDDGFRRPRPNDPTFDVVVAFYSILQQVSTHGQFAASVRNMMSLLRRDGTAAFEFVDYDLSLELFPPSSVGTLYSDGDTEVRVGSTYHDDHLSTEFKGSLNGKDFSWIVDLFRLVDTTVVDSLAAMGCCASIKPFAAGERRRLAVCRFQKWLRRPIAIVGPAAVGKSVVGRALEERLPVRCIDIDEIFRERFSSIEAYGERHGWDQYFLKQSELIEEWVRRVADDYSPSILVLPASALSRPEYPDAVARNRETVLNNCQIIALTASSDIQRAARTSTQRQRDRNYSFDSVAKTELFFHQTEEYAKMAETVIVNDAAPEATAHDLIAYLRAH